YSRFAVLTRSGFRMKRLPWQLLAVTGVFLILPATSLADNGNAPPTLSFFSGGDGAHADWLATSDQPPGDTDNQAIRLLTTNGAIFEPYTQGSPRLVVEFQNAVGEPDGYGDLRENIRGNGWEEVSDQTNYPNSAWDVMG